MEASGFALSVIALLLSIKGALDTAILIESCFDSSKSDYGSTALGYHIEKVRLHIWAEHCKLNDPSQNTIRDRPVLIQETVLRILREVEHLHHEAGNLVAKHSVELAPLPDEDNLEAAASVTLITRSRVDSSARQANRVKSRIKWLIKSKSEFEKIISSLRKHNKDLQDLTLAPGESHVLSQSLPSQMLPALNSVPALNELEASNIDSNPVMAFSARAKAIQKTLESRASGSATIISARQLKALNSVPNVSILHCSDGKRIQVWVEWNVFSPAPESVKHADRIRSLGYILEQVGEAALRLPRCYGVVEDFSYIEKHGSRRIGYIMGPPSFDPLTGNMSPKPLYENNISKYPFYTLADLIRGQKGIPIPLLGDRFTLAYHLASAFGLFHSAGWLHKGFRSENIIFFQVEGENKLSTVDPFITGFQYSRPQDEYSLSQGPLENKSIEYYYHPDADKAFTKQRDLYSLGVVLYEIARWNLVPDTVRPEKRKQLVNRQAWKDHFVAKALPELGWRVGANYEKAVGALLRNVLPGEDEGGDDSNYFSQQYYERVIRPLSICRA